MKLTQKIAQVKMNRAHKKALRFNELFDKFQETAKIADSNERHEAEWALIENDYDLRAFDRELRNQEMEKIHKQTMADLDEFTKKMKELTATLAEKKTKANA